MFVAFFQPCHLQDPAFQNVLLQSLSNFLQFQSLWGRKTQFPLNCPHTFIHIKTVRMHSFILKLSACIYLELNFLHVYVLELSTCICLGIVHMYFSWNCPHVFVFQSFARFILNPSHLGGIGVAITLKGEKQMINIDRR